MHGGTVDIFQQWQLGKIYDEFSFGESPTKNEISFEAITTLIKPLFEQEGALLEEDEIKRHLEELITLGYLSTANGAYFLTFKALVYVQASTSITQAVQDELRQTIKRHWWKAAGILVLTVILVTVITVTILK